MYNIGMILKNTLLNSEILALGGKRGNFHLYKNIKIIPTAAYKHHTTAAIKGM